MLNSIMSDTVIQLERQIDDVETELIKCIDKEVDGHYVIGSDNEIKIELPLYAINGMELNIKGTPPLNIDNSSEEFIKLMGPLMDKLLNIGEKKINMKSIHCTKCQKTGGVDDIGGMIHRQSQKVYYNIIKEDKNTVAYLTFSDYNSAAKVNVCDVKLHDFKHNKAIDLPTCVTNYKGRYDVNGIIDGDTIKSFEKYNNVETYISHLPKFTFNPKTKYTKINNIIDKTNEIIDNEVKNAQPTIFNETIPNYKFNPTIINYENFYIGVPLLTLTENPNTYNLSIPDTKPNNCVYKFVTDIKPATQNVLNGNLNNISITILYKDIQLNDLIIHFDKPVLIH